MQKYTGSPVVWIRAIQSTKQAARYVSKYVSKGPGRFTGCKRYWRSQDYILEHLKDKPIHDSGRTWWLSPYEVEEITEKACRWGWVIDEGDTVRVTLKPQRYCMWTFGGKGPPDGLQGNVI